MGGRRRRKLIVSNCELDYNYLTLEMVVALSRLALCKGCELQVMSQETAVVKAASSFSRTAVANLYPSSVIKYSHRLLKTGVNLRKYNLYPPTVACYQGKKFIAGSGPQEGLQSTPRTNWYLQLCIILLRKWLLGILIYLTEAWKAN